MKCAALSVPRAPSSGLQPSILRAPDSGLTYTIPQTLNSGLHPGTVPQARDSWQFVTVSQAPDSGLQFSPVQPIQQAPSSAWFTTRHWYSTTGNWSTPHCSCATSKQKSNTTSCICSIASATTDFSGPQSHKACFQNC